MNEPKLRFLLTRDDFWPEAIGGIEMITLWAPPHKPYKYDGTWGGNLQYISIPLNDCPFPLKPGQCIELVPKENEK